MTVRLYFNERSFIQSAVSEYIQRKEKSMSVEAEFADHALLLGVVEVTGLAFLVALASETVWDVWRGKRASLKETFANAAIAIVSAVLERTAYGLVFIVGLLIAEPFQLVDIPAAWWTIPLAVLAADFTYYWMHRCEHTVRLFWANHSVHHSSPEFNFSTALRLSWIDALVSWLFYVPMVLIGFSAVETIIGMIVGLAYQSWIHTEKVGRLGWLDRVFNTPSAHRVHHGTNTEYIDRNFGGILIVWDRLFGTYQAEGEKVRYGILPPVGSHNPLVINFSEYAAMLRDLGRAENVRTALRHVFGAPGWRPQGKAAEKNPVAK